MPQREQSVPRRTISSRNQPHSHSVAHPPENETRPGVEGNVGKPYRGKGF